MLRDGSVTSQLWRFTPRLAKWTLLGGGGGSSRESLVDGVNDNDINDNNDSEGRGSGSGGSRVVNKMRRKMATPGHKRGLRHSDDDLGVFLSSIGGKPRASVREKLSFLKAALPMDQDTTPQFNFSNYTGDYDDWFTRGRIPLEEENNTAGIESQSLNTLGTKTNEEEVSTSTTITTTTAEDGGVGGGRWQESWGHLFGSSDNGSERHNRWFIDTYNDQATAGDTQHPQQPTDGDTQHPPAGDTQHPPAGDTQHPQQSTDGAAQQPTDGDPQQPTVGATQHSQQPTVGDPQQPQPTAGSGGGSGSDRIRRSAQANVSGSVSNEGGSSNSWDTEGGEGSESSGDEYSSSGGGGVCGRRSSNNHGGGGGGGGGAVVLCAPVGVVGGGAVIVDDGGAGARGEVVVEEEEGGRRRKRGRGPVMLVIFGYSPDYGFMNTVQEYHFGSNTWSLVATSGAVVDGRYGHTLVVDSATGFVILHGGLVAATTTSNVVHHLLSYDHRTRFWVVLPASPVSVYLHTAVMLSPAAMLLFGGNSHNDTSVSHSARCYSHTMWLYDTLCGTWHTQHLPLDLGVDIARFGHNMVIVEVGGVRGGSPTGLVVGGFNGRMVGSSLLLHPGLCSPYTLPLTCLKAYPSIKCVWNSITSTCEVYSPSHLQERKGGGGGGGGGDYIVCSRYLNSSTNNNNKHQPAASPSSLTNDSGDMFSHHDVSSVCSHHTECVTCVLHHTTTGCVWCAGACHHKLECDESSSSQKVNVRHATI